MAVTIEERAEMIKTAGAPTLLDWYDLYSREYKPLGDNAEGVEETYKMIRAEIIRRLREAY